MGTFLTPSKGNRKPCRQTSVFPHGFFFQLNIYQEKSCKQMKLPAAELRGILLIKLLSLLCFFWVCTVPTAQATYFLSTQNDATLGGLTFQEDDVIEYDPALGTSVLRLEGDNFSSNENIDALHVMNNGNVVMVISTTLGATLGGITFEDGDLLRYDPIRDVADYFFHEDDHFNLTEDIDALSILDNGNLVLSTDNDAQLGNLSFSEGDLVEYDLSSKTASLFFDGSLFGEEMNIDAVNVNADGTIVLSTATEAVLAGLTFDEDDLVSYDPATGMATHLFDGEGNFSLQENIDAVSMSPVPLPGAIWLVVTGLGLSGFQKMRKK
jgi:hypothetical protein